MTCIWVFAQPALFGFGPTRLSSRRSLVWISRPESTERESLDAVPTKLYLLGLPFSSGVSPSVHVVPQRNPHREGSTIARLVFHAQADEVGPTCEHLGTADLVE